MRWVSAVAWLNASDDSPADEELIRVVMFGLVEQSHLVRAPRPPLPLRLDVDQLHQITFLPQRT